MPGIVRWTLGEGDQGQVRACLLCVIVYMCDCPHAEMESKYMDVRPIDTSEDGDARDTREDRGGEDNEEEDNGSDGQFGWSVIVILDTPSVIRVSDT